MEGAPCRSCWRGRCASLSGRFISAQTRWPCGADFYRHDGVRGFPRYASGFRPIPATPVRWLCSNRAKAIRQETSNVPRFEVWQSPGGRTWQGRDQEEAILTALQARRAGVITEIAEVFNLAGELRLRRLACFDDRVNAARPA